MAGAVVHRRWLVLEGAPFNVRLAPPREVNRRDEVAHGTRSYQNYVAAQQNHVSQCGELVLT